MKKDFEDFIATDFHVHTPASSCYKGDKNEDEYLDILKRYIEKKVKIIAITDHNTIKGYKKLIEIKEKLKSKKSTLCEILVRYPELQNEIDQIEDNLKLFDQIFVLPGIEFEATPGIHLLFIFDPKQNLFDIDNFLINCGYPESSQGMENGISVNIDVIEALRRAKELNALTIAAHIDSDKGIYKDLRGLYRAKIFTSEYLDGVSINSSRQIEIIKSLLKDPEYKREKLLGIIQSSDHHSKADCAKHLTYLKLTEFSFESILESFRSPIELISHTERPEIINIIKKIAEDENTICLETINNESILKAACALLNIGRGSILIGVTSDKFKNIVGIDIDEDPNIHNLIRDNILPESIFYLVEIGRFPFGSKHIIQIKIINNSNKQFSFNENYYLWNSNTIVQNKFELLSSLKTLQITNDLNDYHTSTDSKLLEIRKELDLLMFSKNSLDLINKINTNAIKLSGVLLVNIVHPENNYVLKSHYNHGLPIGNVFYVESEFPRRSDIYIRCTCPITNEIKDLRSKIFKGDAIVIVPDGASYIVNDVEDWKIINLEKSKATLVCRAKKDTRDIVSLYVLLGWFKSSLFLWYLYNNFRSLDIRSPKIFNKIYVPTEIFESRIAETIQERIVKIIELEKVFLSTEVKFVDENDQSVDNKKIFEQVIIDHNNSVDELAFDIDNILYDCFKINDEEKNLIDVFLQNKNLHSLKASIQ